MKKQKLFYSFVKNMMIMDFITVKQYAKEAEVTTGYVTRQLKNGAKLAGIHAYIKIGNTWVLYLASDYKAQIKNYKKTRKFAK